MKARPADYACLLLLATLWASSYAFLKVGVATIPPITLIAGRTLIAGLLLVAVMRLRGVGLPRDWASWRAFLFQAAMNSVLPFTLIAWAELTVDAGLAVILNSTTPIFTFLFSLMVLRNEPAPLSRWVGTGLGLLGVVLVIGVDALDGLGGDLIGQLAILLATACYAVAAIFGRRFKDMDPMAPAAGSMLAGTAVLIPASLVIDQPWTLAPSAASVGAMLALAVGSTALAFVLYFHLLRSIGSVGVTSQAYLRVPIGVAISVVFLGESLAPTAYAGLALVVLGVVAMTMPARKKMAA